MLPMSKPLQQQEEKNNKKHGSLVHFNTKRPLACAAIG